MTASVTSLVRPEVDGPPGSTAAAPGPQPASGGGTTKSRLIGIDVCRGLALLGMMAVHALVPFDADGSPNWVSDVATGNASAVFALLAGVGLSLTTGRAAVPRSRMSSTVASIAGRAAAVGVIGLLLGYAEAEVTGVILTFYAVMFLLAIPLLFLRTRTLVLVGVIAAVAVPVLSHLIRPALPEAVLRNPSFLDVFDRPVGLLLELVLTGAYPALPWVSYICAGLVVGRLTLSSLTIARRMLFVGVALAVSAGTASWWLLGPQGGRAALRAATPGGLNLDDDTVDDLLVFGFDGTTPTGSWWWLATDAPHAATPFDLLRTIGTAVAVLGVTLMLGHITAPVLQRGLRLVTAPLAAAGTMTLTLYAAHVVFMNSPLDQFSPVGGYVFQVVAVLLLALGWRQAVGRGPLETLVTAVAVQARGWATRGTDPRTPRGQAQSASETADQEAWSWWGEVDQESPVDVSSTPWPRHPRRRARARRRHTADQEMWSWSTAGPNGQLDPSRSYDNPERPS